VQLIVATASFMWVGTNWEYNYEYPELILCPEGRLFNDTAFLEARNVTNNYYCLKDVDI
jgi:hypothetical protein